MTINCHDPVAAVPVYVPAYIVVDVHVKELSPVFIAIYNTPVFIGVVHVKDDIIIFPRLPFFS